MAAAYPDTVDAVFGRSCAAGRRGATSASPVRASRSSATACSSSPPAVAGKPANSGRRSREVEELVSTRHGDRYLRERQARTELKQVNRELKQHRAQLAALEERRSALLAELGEQAVRKPG